MICCTEQVQYGLQCIKVLKDGLAMSGVSHAINVIVENVHKTLRVRRGDS